MCWIHSPHKKLKSGLRPINNQPSSLPMYTSGVHMGLRRGQVAIEATIAIVAIFIFLLGVTQVFLWMNQNIIARQKAYQETRVELGDPEKINFYEPSRLYVFPQEAGGRR